ncbi:MAG: TspO/MBR family protein [Pseudomonadota bacterium]
MSAYSAPKQVVGLVIWFFVCFAVSAIGALASVQARSFYQQLAQPAWAPPGWVFGPVWTVLFACMAIAVWLVWRTGGFQANRSALTVFCIQLGFNAVWSWLFFAWNLGLMAFVEVLILWLLILATLILFWRKSVLAGALFVPYLLWVSFAAVLSYSLWQLNPTILG